MSLEDIQKDFAEFKQERGWEKFHEPKNIAMSISIESAELMELFQWKDNVDIERIKSDSELMDNIREELGDIILYSLSMAQKLDIDLEEAVEDKLKENKDRFDEERSEALKNNLNNWTKN
jgi:NTP pyrophosphatase (non-canonical NTP hydrolase)